MCQKLTISELKYTIKIHQMTSKRVIRKINRDIESALLPILESWSGQKLSKDAIIYGVRRYYRLEIITICELLKINMSTNKKKQPVSD